MRYDDWDVILFPTGRDCKIPFKEFKVTCHVVPDLELAHIHGAVGLPVMTCFVPSLPPGAGFQVSIHCWRKPNLSQFARTYSKHSSLIKFEARILIDGRQVASTVLDRDVNGPHLITSTCEFTKTGELERLRFPHFRREILYQNHWRPSDNIGRIKIVISEGFPRDSLSAPIERVKNVVAFSFQHAPLEILEASSIAWPNQLMWQCSPFSPAMPVPTYQVDEGPSSHTHSPGHKSLPLRNIKSQAFSVPSMTSAAFQTPASSGILGDPALQVPYVDYNITGSTGAPLYPDPFTESAYLEWANVRGGGQRSDAWDSLGMWPTNERNQRQSASDTAMPDYVPPPVLDAMHVSGPSLEEEPSNLKVPTNTPIGDTSEDDQNTLFPMTERPAVLPSDFASSLTRSLLNQPFPLPVPQHNCDRPALEIKSKNGQHAMFGQSNAGDADACSMPQPTFATSADNATHRVPSSVPSYVEAGPTMTSSLPAAPGNPMQELSPGHGDKSAAGVGSSKGNNAGAKRTRNFTPTSAKAIDEADEPRLMSPQMRADPFSVVDMLGSVG